MLSVLNQRFVVTRWGFLALAALSASALASQERSVLPQNPAQPVKVTVAGKGGLSIQVNASPIAAALDAVSAKSGVPIHYQGAPEQPVSLTCHGDTLRSLLFASWVRMPISFSSTGNAGTRNQEGKWPV
jgi:hypothetical protein